MLDVGPRDRVEVDVARLEEPAVAVQLDPPLDLLDVEVGDAHEDRPGHGRRRGPDRERDDRLVVALAADRERADGRRRP